MRPYVKFALLAWMALAIISFLAPAVHWPQGGISGKYSLLGTQLEKF